MRLSPLALVLGLGLASLCSAQHNVYVALDAEVFTPNQLNASVGDTVTFHFVGAGTHSVTQTSFAEPCAPSPGGFNSGLITVSSGIATSFPIVTIQITGTEPIYYVCAQPGHCQNGMVGTINVDYMDGSHNFNAFQVLAMGSTPGLFDGGVAVNPNGVSAVITSYIGEESSDTPISSTDVPLPTSTTSDKSNHSTQVKIGVGVGIAVLAVLCIAGVVLTHKINRMKRRAKSQRSMVRVPMNWRAVGDSKVKDPKEAEAA